jgi:hypothetical protein
VNRLFYHPRVIRLAKAAVPERSYELAKRVRQLNLSPPPKLPDDLRARLLDIYRDDISKLEGLLERDLSIWLDGR